MFTAGMNLLDLTPKQLKRAAAIKEQIADLNVELRKILGITTTSAAPAKKNRIMSAAAKTRISAAQKVRWARLRDAKAAVPSKTTAKKKRMSAAARAKLSAKLKAYWAAKKSSKK
jgi:hypothetical protein